MISQKKDIYKYNSNSFILLSIISLIIVFNNSINNINSIHNIINDANQYIIYFVIWIVRWLKKLWKCRKLNYWWKHRKGITCNFPKHCHKVEKLKIIECCRYTEILAEQREFHSNCKTKRFLDWILDPDGVITSTMLWN